LGKEGNGRLGENDFSIHLANRRRGATHSKRIEKIIRGARRSADNRKGGGEQGGKKEICITIKTAVYLSLGKRIVACRQE